MHAPECALAAYLRRVLPVNSTLTAGGGILPQFFAPLAFRATRAPHPEMRMCLLAFSMESKRRYGGEID